MLYNHCVFSWKEQTTNATPEKATPKLDLNSSPKISIQATNEDATSTLNISSNRSSRRKEQTTKLLPLVERLKDRSFNPFIILDPLTSSTEGALKGIDEHKRRFKGN